MGESSPPYGELISEMVKAFKDVHLLVMTEPRHLSDLW
jgi:hypothetical protein